MRSEIIAALQRVQAFQASQPTWDADSPPVVGHDYMDELSLDHQHALRMVFTSIAQIRACCEQLPYLIAVDNGTTTSIELSLP